MNRFLMTISLFSLFAFLAALTSAPSNAQTLVGLDLYLNNRETTDCLTATGPALHWEGEVPRDPCGLIGSDHGYEIDLSTVYSVQELPGCRLTYVLGVNDDGTFTEYGWAASLGTGGAAPCLDVNDYVIPRPVHVIGPRALLSNGERHTYWVHQSAHESLEIQQISSPNQTHKLNLEVTESEWSAETTANFIAVHDATPNGNPCLKGCSDPENQNGDSWAEGYFFASGQAFGTLLYREDQ